MAEDAVNVSGGGAIDPTSLPLFEAHLTPHRSLSPRHFRLLMIVFSLAATVSSAPFVLLGAWPVAGFMGLDILLLYTAFRLNFDAARAYEDIILTPLELMLAKVSARGGRKEFRFNPVWVRLDREEHAEFGLLRLALRSKGRSVEVAGFLGPAAKADFASGLTSALAEARRGPRFPQCD